MLILVAGLLAAAAAGVWIVWRGHRLRGVQDRYGAERERNWLHEVIARSLNEIYIFEPDTLRFRFANDGACRNLGYTRDELAELTPLDVKPRFTRDAFLAMLEPLRGAGRPAHSFETIHRRKDGSEYSVEVHLQLVDSGAGDVFLAVLNDVTAKNQASEALKLFRTLVDQSNDGLEVIDLETGRFLDMNERGCNDLGYSRDELLSMTVFDIDPAVDQASFAASREMLRRSGRQSWEGVHRRKDGSTFPVEVGLTLVRLDREYLVAVSRDVTERRRAEKRIQDLNRVHAVLSEVNQAIARVRDPQKLFAEACRIAVETGGFRVAWIGMLDPKLNVIQPVAHAGVTDDYLDHLRIGLADGPHRLGPTASALRSGRHVVCNDIEHDPRVAAGLADALARGCRASAAFPLIVGGQAQGTISILATEAGFFDGQEVHLLDRMAANLSFGMEMAKLEAAGRRLTTAIEQSPVAVMIASLDKRIEYVNPAFTRLTGYSAEEALGANPWILKSGTDDRAFYEDLWATITEGRSWRGEVIGLAKDGTPYTEDLTVAPVRDGEGKVLHYVGIGQDVTERRKAEATLRASEERYRTLFDRNLAGVYRTTLGGRIVDCNDAFVRIFGYASRDDVLRGGADTLYATPGDREAFLKLLRSEGVAVNHEFEGRRRDGAKVWLLANAHLVKDDGAAREPIVEGTLIDVTERRLAVEAQTASLKEKEALLREVHHRVKNNLQVIASLLHIEARKADHEVTKSVLIQMNDRVRSMALLHQTLCDSGKFARVDLASYLKQLSLQLLRSLAVQPGAVRMDFDLTPVTVEFDRAIPCGLIVNELVSNSLKHGFPEGRTGEVCVRLRPTGGGASWELSVSDNGVGLPQDFELRRQRSLGIQLVSDLTRQLQGTLKIGPAPEAVFEMTFAVTRTLEIPRRPGISKPQEGD